MARLGLPDLGLGLGLRATHYRHLLETSPQVAVFELLTENFLETAGRPLEILDQLAPRQPVVMHGVALGIGSTARLDAGYLRAVCALRDRVHAHWVSDHLCFTGITGANSHDLLPLSLTSHASADNGCLCASLRPSQGLPRQLRPPSCVSLRAS